jgi:hypothetical protein
MAKITNNIFLKGLSGSVGDMVFRQMPDGSTRVSAKPVSRHKSSQKQKEHQSRFHQAVAYAREASKEEPIYTELTRGTSMNAYNLALADYLKPPVIHAIERRDGRVRVTASDNVMVTRVQVSILDGEGNLLEQGDAALADPVNDPAGWEYACSAEGTVAATAWDLAYNQTTAVL